MNAPDSAKSYSLSFEHRTGYLYAFVEGEKDSYEISIQYWKEIAGRLKETGIKKVLVEENIAEEISTSEVFRLASELAVVGFAGIKVAFVDRQLSHKESNDFGVLVGSNRGLFVKGFNDAAEAETWLLSDER